MTGYDGKELLDRFVAIEKEAIAVLTPSAPPCDAFPRWFAASERFPYWTNALASQPKDYGADAFSDEGATYPVVVWAKLVIGHVTTGLRGEVDERFLTWLPQLVEYFEARKWLQSAAFDVPMDYLEAADYLDARFVPKGPPAPSGADTVCIEFQFQCRFKVTVAQAYLG